MLTVIMFRNCSMPNTTPLMLPVIISWNWDADRVYVRIAPGAASPVNKRSLSTSGLAAVCKDAGSDVGLGKGDSPGTVLDAAREVGRERVGQQPGL